MGNILQRLIYNLSAMAPLCFIFALLWYWQKKTMDIPCIVMCIGVALVILFMISFSYGKRHLAQIKVILGFLDEEAYKGPFSQNTFLANSKRRVNK